MPPSTLLKTWLFIKIVKDINIEFTATFKLTGTVRAMDWGPYDQYDDYS